MKTTSLLSFALLATLAACHAGNTDSPKDFHPVKRPPHVPPAVATPIDPALQARARNELHTALASSDELVRAHALEVVKNVPQSDADAIVNRALLDRSTLVRKAAALTAGELKLESTRSHLEADVDTAPLPEQMADVFALHRLGDTSRSHLFEHTAIYADKYVRGDTALMLGMLGDRSATPILVQMLSHDREQLVREQAAEALWKLGDERGLNELVGDTISIYPDDRMIAATALAAPRDTRVVGNVEGMLTDDYPEVALVAAAAAGRLGSDNGYTVATNATKNGDPRYRFLGAMALGAISRPDAQPILAKLLDDSSADVRLAAAEAILQIGVGNFRL